MGKSWVASLAVAVGLVASCGGGAAEQKPVANMPAPEAPEPPPSTTPEPSAETEANDRTVARLRLFKDNVCACSNATCVEAIQQLMMDWAMENMASIVDVQHSPPHNAESHRLGEEMEACNARHGSATTATATSPVSPSASRVVLKPLRPGGTGVATCDEYVRTMDGFIITCQEKLGPALDALVKNRNAAIDAFAAWEKADAKSRQETQQRAEMGCQAATDAIRQSAAAMGCPS